MKVYIDWRDWWVGFFVDTYYIYVCPLPCLVFRFSRGWSDIELCKFIDVVSQLPEEDRDEALEYLQQYIRCKNEK